MVCKIVVKKIKTQGNIADQMFRSWQSHMNDILRKKAFTNIKGHEAMK